MQESEEIDAALPQRRNNNADDPSGTQASEQDDENEAQTKQNSGGYPEIRNRSSLQSKAMNKQGGKPETTEKTVRKS